MRCRLAFLAAVILLAAAAPLQGQTGREVTVDTGSGVLAGTLLVPEGAGPFPVVLIIVGSGPTDRDGNLLGATGRNNCLAQLARGLVGDGIASLRYDKRGLGGSAAARVPELALDFERLIADAVAWCRLLQNDPRFSTLTIAGHSQGSHLGMNAAWRVDADGFVSIAGPARPILEVIREQLTTRLTPAYLAKADAIIDTLAAGGRVTAVPPELMSVFRPSIQAFLKSWHRHHPALEIARLSAPVLVIQGDADIQVPVSDAEALAAAHPRNRLVVIEGMNHVLKNVPRDDLLRQEFSYVDSTRMIMPQVVSSLVDFIGLVGDRAPDLRAARRRAEDLARQGRRLLDPDREAELLREEAGLSISAKISRWARRFVDPEGRVEYLFGLKEDGYVAEGRLMTDLRQDCVSLLYRCTELARAEDPRDAVAWALRTRFAGAPLDSVVDVAGKVDYDRPEHLDFSLDMIRSGIWGHDVTPRLQGAVLDTVGSSQFPAGAFHLVPGAALVKNELHDGDVVWFVLDPMQKIRQEHGLVIGHIGMVVVRDQEAILVHAASSDLEGVYEGGSVVAVPLETYLNRLNRFAGIMVTRF